MPYEGQLKVPTADAAGAEVAFVCDERGVVVAASETMRRLLGRAGESLSGEPLARLAVPEDEEEVRRGLADATARAVSAFSVRLASRAGPPLATRISALRVRVEGGAAILCLAAALPDRRRRAEERAERIADTQKAIATILALALEDIPLDDLLRRTLDLILEIPWLSIERKGAILLAEEEAPGALVLRVQRGLADPVVASCARVPFGRCLCGRAAVRREPVYAAELDERHETRYPGIAAHGHYCVPICSEGATLGVITTYLAPGHERSETELEFLMAVANTLAGVLVRRRADAGRRRAERVSQAKSELLALVSHELLTPVTAVLLGCERLERDRSAPLAPRHAAILSRMEGALGRLASTIRLLLEHARLDGEGASVQRAPVDVAALAVRVLAGVRSSAERKGLAVGIAIESPLPFLWTDERLLELVLANLASNAVKFTEAGSVAIRAGYRQGAHWIAIEDTGPGIPPSERDRLFERFEPLEPLANKHAPGMGLGLALAHRLAAALGGRLELERDSGRGSTFVLTLPQAVEEKDAIALH